jgi:hypothetical protein
MNKPKMIPKFIPTKDKLPINPFILGLECSTI